MGEAGRQAVPGLLLLKGIPEEGHGFGVCVQLNLDTQWALVHGACLLKVDASSRTGEMGWPPGWVPDGTRAGKTS